MRTIDVSVSPRHVVADPTLAEDVDRIGSVVAQLAAQPLHDGTDEFGVDRALVPSAHACRSSDS